MNMSDIFHGYKQAIVNNRFACRGAPVTYGFHFLSLPARTIIPPVDIRPGDLMETDVRDGQVYLILRNYFPIWRHGWNN